MKLEDMSKDQLIELVKRQELKLVEARADSVAIPLVEFKAVQPVQQPSPEVGAPFAGGIYAGMTIHNDQLARLVLLPDAAEDITWNDAVIWISTVGAELPTRQELITLYQNLNSEFERDWYWSGEHHKATADFAWHQTFVNGNQLYYHKSYAGRARAVLRLPINQ